jgi:hypothetical protein
MANPGPSLPNPLVNVGTFPTDGIDFSANYIINTNSVGGSGYAPEFPRPPFLPGTQAFGSNGSMYVFVQVGASNSPIANTAAAPSTILPWMAVQIDQNFLATPLNTTGFFNKWAFGINSTPNTVVFYNTSTISSYFWAAIRGANLAVLAGNIAANSAYNHSYGQTAATSAGRVIALSSPSYVVTGIVFTQSYNTGSVNSASAAGPGLPVQLYATWPRMSTASNANTGGPGPE